MPRAAGWRGPSEDGVSDQLGGSSDAAAEDVGSARAGCGGWGCFRCCAGEGFGGRWGAGGGAGMTLLVTEMTMSGE